MKPAVLIPLWLAVPLWVVGIGVVVVAISAVLAVLAVIACIALLWLAAEGLAWLALRAMGRR